MSPTSPGRTVSREVTVLEGFDLRLQIDGGHFGVVSVGSYHLVPLEGKISLSS